MANADDNTAGNASKRGSRASGSVQPIDEENTPLLDFIILY